MFSDKTIAIVIFVKNDGHISYLVIFRQQGI